MRVQSGERQWWFHMERLEEQERYSGVWAMQAAHDFIQNHTTHLTYASMRSGWTWYCHTGHNDYLNSRVWSMQWIFDQRFSAFYCPLVSSIDPGKSCGSVATLWKYILTLKKAIFWLPEKWIATKVSFLIGISRPRPLHICPVIGRTKWQATPCYRHILYKANISPPTRSWN